MSNKGLLVLILLGISIVVIFAVVYNNLIVKPTEREENVTVYNVTDETLLEENQALKNQSASLKTNLTSVEQQLLDAEKSKNRLSIILILLLLGIVGGFIYYKYNVTTSDIKTRDQIVQFLRGYSRNFDGIQLYRLVKYKEGFYKAMHDFPIALAIFCTNPNWRLSTTTGAYVGEEPPEEFLVGYLVDRKNPQNVIEDFSGMSVKNILLHLKNTEWGLETPHAKPYKKKSFEQEIEQFYAGAQEKARQIDIVSKELERLQ